MAESKRGSTVKGKVRRGVISNESLQPGEMKDLPKGSDKTDEENAQITARGDSVWSEP